MFSLKTGILDYKIQQEQDAIWLLQIFNIKSI